MHAKAGIQFFFFQRPKLLDSRLRGNERRMLRFLV